PSCADFVKALKEAAREEPPPPHTDRWLRAALAGTSLLVVLLVGLLVYHLVGRRDGTPATPPGEDPAPGARAAEPWLPPGAPGDFEKHPDAAPVVIGGQAYWDRLVCNEVRGAPMEFLFFKRDRQDAPPSFYILRDKVTRAQFAAAMADPAMRSIVGPFREAQAWTVPGKWTETWAKSGLTGEKGRRPATDLTVTEAYCFAAWAAGEYGQLPAPDQWDRAGGRLDGKKGPYREELLRDPKGRHGKIALSFDDDPVGLKEPRPVGTSEADESLFPGHEKVG